MSESNGPRRPISMSGLQQEIDELRSIILSESNSGTLDVRAGENVLAVEKPRGPISLHDLQSDVDQLRALLLARNIPAQGPITATADITLGEVTLSAQGQVSSVGQGNIGIAGHPPTAIVERPTYSERIFGQSQSETLFAIDNAMNEIEIARELALAYRTHAEFRRNNNPPDPLIDGLIDPEIELSVLEDARSSLVVLRKLIVQPEPDVDFLKLLLSLLLKGLKSVLKILTWARGLSKAALKRLLNSTVGQSFQKRLGDIIAIEVIHELVVNGPTWALKIVELLKIGVKTVN